MNDLENFLRMQDEDDEPEAPRLAPDIEALRLEPWQQEVES